MTHARRNHPTVIIRPESPCLQCSLPSIGHKVGHAPIHFMPRWAVPQFMTGMCELCSDAPERAGGYCLSCLASYWKFRPLIAARLLDAGKKIAI